MKIIINLIKKNLTLLSEILQKKIEERNQQEQQRQQILEEKARRAIEISVGNALRRRWSLALNSLPTHMRISNNDIDSNSLSNRYMNVNWELHISLQEPLSRTKCEELKSRLSEILNNQYLEAYQDFQNRIFQDYNEYAYQCSLVANGRERTKEDFILLSNYNKFANANYYRLINITIVDVCCIDNELQIQYEIEESACQQFNLQNYWNRITRI